MLEGETVEEQYLYDVGTGVMLFGIPDVYHLTRAAYEGDMDSFAYYSAVAAGVHGTWYAAYRGVRAYDIARHGGKNIAGMSYHSAIQGKGPLATLAVRTILLPMTYGYAAYNVGTMPHRMVGITGGKGGTRTHAGGTMSFRNPISGM